MKRRRFLAIGAILACDRPRARANESSQTFEQLLSIFATDPHLVEDAWKYRDRTASRGVGFGARSDRAISQRAVDMIVRLEIGSQQRYQRSYQTPVWPKGESGVTIGVGYDLKFASKSILRRDWGQLLDESTLSRLDMATRLYGSKAEAMAASLSSVHVPWEAAYTQFSDFLPYVAAQTESVFANCDRE